MSLNIKHLITKIISWVIVFSFLLQDLSVAGPDVFRLDLGPQKPNLSWAKKLLPEIPESIASIEDAWQVPEGSDPSGTKTVILIQDAHTNSSCQLNESKLFDLLFEHGITDTVFTEAAKGNVNLTFLRDKASLPQREQIAKEYLQKGLLHGIEYLDLTSDHQFKIEGVEDPDLYFQSLKVYKDSVKKRDSFERYLNEIESTIDVLKSKLLNPFLLNFLQAKDKQKDNLSDYIQTLLSQANTLKIDLSKYPNLKKLNDLKSLESKINFKTATLEQQKAVQSLSARDKTELSSDSVSKLSMKDSQRGFFLLLEEKLLDDRRQEVGDRSVLPPNAYHLSPMKNYPNLSQYFQYLDRSKELSPKDILKEQKDLETQVLKALTTNEDEERLLQSIKTLAYYKKLFYLSLTPEEYQESKDQSFTDLKVLSGFLNLKLMNLKDRYDKAIFLKEDFTDIQNLCTQFYELTYQRDKAFLSNLLKAVEDKEHPQGATAVGDSEPGRPLTRRQQKPRTQWAGAEAGPAANTYTLITGGYHTPNLKYLLRQQNISYISIIPRVTHETNIKRYEEILLSQPIVTPVRSSPGAMGMSTTFAAGGRALPPSEALATIRENIEHAGGQAAARLANVDQLEKIYGGSDKNGQNIKDESYSSKAAGKPYLQPILISALQGKESGRSLDILSLGSGVGFIENQLNQLGHRTQGIELVSSNVEISRNQNHVDTLQHDINKYYDFGTRKFDVILLSESIGGIADLKTLVAHSLQWLKPGGRVIAADYDTQDENVLSWHRIHGYKYYPRKDIERAFKKSGFEFEVVARKDIRDHKKNGKKHDYVIYEATFHGPTAARLASSADLPNVGDKIWVPAGSALSDVGKSVETLLNKKGVPGYVTTVTDVFTKGPNRGTYEVIYSDDPKDEQAPTQWFRFTDNGPERLERASQKKEAVGARLAKNLNHRSSLGQSSSKYDKQNKKNEKKAERRRAAEDAYQGVLQAYSQTARLSAPERDKIPLQDHITRLEQVLSQIKGVPRSDLYERVSMVDALKVMIANLSGRVGIAYFRLGSLESSQNHFAEAEVYYEKSTSYLDDSVQKKDAGGYHTAYSHRALAWVARVINLYYQAEYLRVDLSGKAFKNGVTFYKDLRAKGLEYFTEGTADGDVAAARQDVNTLNNVLGTAARKTVAADAARLADLEHKKADGPPRMRMVATVSFWFHNFLASIRFIFFLLKELTRGKEPARALDLRLIEAAQDLKGVLDALSFSAKHRASGWIERELRLGSSKAYLSQAPWESYEEALRILEASDFGLNFGAMFPQSSRERERMFDDLVDHPAALNMRVQILESIIFLDKAAIALAWRGRAEDREFERAHAKAVAYLAVRKEIIGKYSVKLRRQIAMLLKANQQLEFKISSEDQPGATVALEETGSTALRLRRVKSDLKIHAAEIQAHGSGARLAIFIWFWDPVLDLFLPPAVGVPGVGDKIWVPTKLSPSEKEHSAKTIRDKNGNPGYITTVAHVFKDGPYKDTFEVIYSDDLNNKEAPMRWFSTLDRGVRILEKASKKISYAGARLAGALEDFWGDYDLLRADSDRGGDISLQNRLLEIFDRHFSGWIFSAEDIRQISRFLFHKLVDQDLSQEKEESLLGKARENAVHLFKMIADSHTPADGYTHTIYLGDDGLLWKQAHKAYFGPAGDQNSQRYFLNRARFLTREEFDVLKASGDGVLNEELFSKGIVIEVMHRIIQEALQGDRTEREFENFIRDRFREEIDHGPIQRQYAKDLVRLAAESDGVRRNFYNTQIRVLADSGRNVFKENVLSIGGSFLSEVVNRVPKGRSVMITDVAVWSSQLFFLKEATRFLDSDQSVGFHVVVRDDESGVYHGKNYSFLRYRKKESIDYLEQNRPIAYSISQSASPDNPHFKTTAHELQLKGLLLFFMMQESTVLASARLAEEKKNAEPDGLGDVFSFPIPRRSFIKAVLASVMIRDDSASLLGQTAGKYAEEIVSSRILIKPFSVRNYTENPLARDRVYATAKAMGLRDGELTVYGDPETGEPAPIELLAYHLQRQDWEHNFAPEWSPRFLRVFHQSEDDGRKRIEREDAEWTAYRDGFFANLRKKVDPASKESAQVSVKGLQLAQKSYLHDKISRALKPFNAQALKIIVPKWAKLAKLIRNLPDPEKRILNDILRDKKTVTLKEIQSAADRGYSKKIEETQSWLNQNRIRFEHIMQKVEGSEQPWISDSEKKLLDDWRSRETEKESSDELVRLGKELGSMEQKSFPWPKDKLRELGRPVSAARLAHGKKQHTEQSQFVEDYLGAVLSQMSPNTKVTVTQTHSSIRPFDPRDWTEGRLATSLPYVLLGHEASARTIFKRGYAGSGKDSEGDPKDSSEIKKLKTLADKASRDLIAGWLQQSPVPIETRGTEGKADESHYFHEGQVLGHDDGGFRIHMFSDVLDGTTPLIMGDTRDGGTMILSVLGLNNLPAFPEGWSLSMTVGEKDKKVVSKLSYPVEKNIITALKSIARRRGAKFKFEDLKIHVGDSGQLGNAGHFRKLIQMLHEAGVRNIRSSSNGPYESLGSFDVVDPDGFTDVMMGMGTTETVIAAAIAWLRGGNTRFRAISVDKINTHKPENFDGLFRPTAAEARAYRKKGQRFRKVYDSDTLFPDRKIFYFGTAVTDTNLAPGGGPLGVYQTNGKIITQHRIIDPSGGVYLAEIQTTVIPNTPMTSGARMATDSIIQFNEWPEMGYQLNLHPGVYGYERGGLSSVSTVKHRDFLISRLKEIRGTGRNVERALILGAGTGWEIFEVLKEFPEAKIIATDRDPRAVASVSDNLLLNSAAINVSRVDVREGSLFVPVADEGLFDLVIFHMPVPSSVSRKYIGQGAFWSVDQAEEALVDLSRHLAPEGEAVVTIEDYVLEAATSKSSSQLLVRGSLLISSEETNPGIDYWPDDPPTIKRYSYALGLKPSGVEARAQAARLATKKASEDFALQFLKGISRVVVLGYPENVISDPLADKQEDANNLQEALLEASKGGALTEGSFHYLLTREKFEPFIAGLVKTESPDKILVVYTAGTQATSLARFEGMSGVTAIAMPSVRPNVPAIKADVIEKLRAALSVKEKTARGPDYTPAYLRNLALAVMLPHYKGKNFKTVAEIGALIEEQFPGAVPVKMNSLAAILDEWTRKGLFQDDKQPSSRSFLLTLKGKQDAERLDADQLRQAPGARLALVLSRKRNGTIDIGPLRVTVMSYDADSRPRTVKLMIERGSEWQVVEINDTEDRLISSDPKIVIGPSKGEWRPGQVAIAIQAARDVQVTREDAIVKHHLSNTGQFNHRHDLWEGLDTETKRRLKEFLDKNQEKPIGLIKLMARMNDGIDPARAMSQDRLIKILEVAGYKPFKLGATVYMKQGPKAQGARLAAVPSESEFLEAISEGGSLYDLASANALTVLNAQEIFKDSSDRTLRRRIKDSVSAGRLRRIKKNGNHIAFGSPEESAARLALSPELITHVRQAVVKAIQENSNLKGVILFEAFSPPLIEFDQVGISLILEKGNMLGISADDLTIMGHLQEPTGNRIQQWPYFNLVMPYLLSDPMAQKMFTLLFMTPPDRMPDGVTVYGWPTSESDSLVGRFTVVTPDPEQDEIMNQIILEGIRRQRSDGEGARLAVKDSRQMAVSSVQEAQVSIAARLSVTPELLEASVIPSLPERLRKPLHPAGKRSSDLLIQGRRSEVVYFLLKAFDAQKRTGKIVIGSQEFDIAVKDGVLAIDGLASKPVVLPYFRFTLKQFDRHAQAQRAVEVSANELFRELFQAVKADIGEVRRLLAGVLNSETTAVLNVHTDVFDLTEPDVLEVAVHSMAVLSARNHMIFVLYGEQKQELYDRIKALDAQSNVFLELPAAYKDAPANTLGTPKDLAALGANQKRTYADAGTSHLIRSILELAAANSKAANPRDNTPEIQNILLAHEIITGNPIADRMEWADVTLGLKPLTNFLYLVRPRPVSAEFDIRMRQAERRWTLQSA